MKSICLILLTLLFFDAKSQKSKVLKIRKLQIDTIFYTEDFIDTLQITINEITLNTQLNSNLSRGKWDGNVFFTLDSFHVFTKWISPRLRKLSYRNPTRFWNKMRRQKRKNKTQIFSSQYSFKQLNANYSIETTTKTFFKLRNRQSSKIIFDEKIALDSTVVRKNRTITDYRYLSAFDSVSLVKRAFNVNTFCGSSSVFGPCLFNTLVANLKSYYQRNGPFGYFYSSSKVEKNRYEMYLNFENYLIKKATITLNNKTRYYCNFEKMIDSIHILNCPTPAFGDGRISKKMNKIKFRYHSRNYKFYKKYKTSHISGFQKLFGYEPEHYNLSLSSQVYE